VSESQAYGVGDEGTEVAEGSWDIGVEAVSARRGHTLSYKIVRMNMFVV
jgi:hypothetical protein